MKDLGPKPGYFMRAFAVKKKELLCSVQEARITL